MAFKHIDVTLSGSTRVTATNTPIQQFILHNPTGNASVTIGDSNLSATSYGILVAAGANSPPIGPFSASAPLSLSEVYVRGTDAQLVHISYVTH